MSIDAPNGTVVLCVPSGTAVQSHTARTLLDMVMLDQRYGRRHLHPHRPFVWSCGSTSVTTARNKLVQKFLEGDGEWMLQVDDDQLYPPDLLERLMAAAHPVDRRIVALPVWRFAGDDGQIRVTHNVFDLAESGQMVEWPDPLPENAVIQVAGVGTGCILIHRSALVEMKAHAEKVGLGDGDWIWFREGFYANGRMKEGEDLHFCRLAGMAEIPVWVLTSPVLGHMKRVVLSGPLPEGALVI